MIGLPIGTAGGHVTVVIRHGCHPKELTQILDVLNQEIVPLLPIPLVIEPGVVMRGYNGDVPTLNVRTEDTTMYDKLNAIYERVYQQIPEWTAYPTLRMHLNIDKDAVREEAENLLRDCQGKFLAKEAMLKKVGDKNLISAGFALQPFYERVYTKEPEEDLLSRSRELTDEEVKASKEECERERLRLNAKFGIVDDDE